MSIADNNPGIMLNGFTNTNLGAEAFEASYSNPPPPGVVANKVREEGNIPAWVGIGGWVGAPWFKGPDAAKIRLQDYYFDGIGSNWDNIATTLPTYNVIGAFALIKDIKDLDPDVEDFEWWSNFHVVGVYDFDLEGRAMKITDSNRDDKDIEFQDEILPPTVGGAILKGPDTLGTLTWEEETGILTNLEGRGADDEKLVSLRVLYNIKDKKDFGDAPNTYKTLLATDGPRYYEGDLQRLGVNWDGEEDGQPSLFANGDDLVHWDDEDGVIFGDSWVDVNFNINRPNKKNIYQLRAWWDNNINGAFDHALELFIDDLLMPEPGTITKRYNLGFNPTDYYSRFRLTWIDDPFGINGGVTLSTDIQPTGEYLGSDGISHGEVEDYAPVPGPLPIFGVAAAFRFSRKLRRLTLYGRVRYPLCGGCRGRPMQPW
jgi:hypothetical protein